MTPPAEAGDPAATYAYGPGEVLWKTSDANQEPVSGTHLGR
jgi:hypothetical protein